MNTACTKISPSRVLTACTPDASGTAFSYKSHPLAALTWHLRVFGTLLRVRQRLKINGSQPPFGSKLLQEALPAQTQAP